MEPQNGKMPKMWGRNGKDGYRFNGGLSICGRKLRPQKEKTQKTLVVSEKGVTFAPVKRRSTYWGKRLSGLYTG